MTSPRAAVEDRDSPGCPGCGEAGLRAAHVPGRYRCVACLRLYELRSECPDCGQHQTIARMTDTANVTCRSCGGNMLREV